MTNVNSADGAETWIEIVACQIQERLSCRYDVPLLTNAWQITVQLLFLVLFPFQNGVGLGEKSVVRDVKVLQLGTVPLEDTGNSLQAVVGEMESL